ncbi:MAG: hypothetical protein EOP07_13670 [Proteobacteria bacterium]|nr:MAG: hypothetical protein EOP07_13670 [Pseudomonadota bacterium]
MKIAFLFGMLLSFIAGTARAAQPLSSPLSPWNGEYMQADQGAVYLRFYLDKFRKTRSSKEITNSVFMNIRNQKTGQIHVLSQGPTDSSAEPILVWKLPSGNYTVEKLSINENTGLTRTWTAQGKRPTFSVRYLLLANMGQVRLSPFGGKGLKVTFLPRPNAFVNTNSHQSFMGVIDAYKGTLQKRLGGSALMKEAKDSFGSGNEARVAFTTTRQISMIHQVDSSGSQKNRRLMSSTISAQDAELRRCYMDQLDVALGIRGSVNFKFQISPSNGSFAALSYSGGSMNSPRAIECLTLSLKKMQFPITQALSGRLAFQFNYDDNPGRAKF